MTPGTSFKTKIYLLFDCNGPRYVGKTIQPLANRLWCHKKRWAWVVECLVIEIVSSEDRWQDRENFWIIYYSQWYKLENVRPGGNGTSTHSEETKRKISEGQRGKKRSVEFGKKMSLALKGRKQSPEHIQHAKEGKARSLIPRKPIVRKKGLKASPAQRAKNPFCKQYKGQPGRPQSQKTKDKLSKLLKGRGVGKNVSQETRYKLSQASTAAWERRKSNGNS